MRTLFYWLAGKVRRERTAAVYDYCARVVETSKLDPVAASMFRDAERELTKRN